MTITASIQIFANRQSHEDDAARAEEAVNAHLATLPADAGGWRDAYVAEMDGEDHDTAAAKQWHTVEADCYRIAQQVGLAGWAKPEATISIEFVA